MAEGRPYPGYLITFEGSEGSGRRDALAHARAALLARGQDVIVSRPMGQTLAGGIYRSAAPLNELSPRTLVLVAASDMAERLEWEILPALRAGKTVLADRYAYRIIQGIARDLDPDWLEVLCSVAPRPDLVFMYRDEDSLKRDKFDPATIDLYEAGMDLGLTRDVPFSYQLYQQRVQEGYHDWAEAHGIELIQPTLMSEVVSRIERLIGIEVGDLNLRHQAVLDMLMKQYHDPPHALQVASLAYQLFDQLRALHGQGNTAAELFEFGVLLHNVGETTREHREKHVRTAQIIRESALPGFSSDELNVMGVIAAAHTMKHHRELEAWLTTVPPAYREMVEKLAPLARLADGMDASHEQTVRWVEAILAEEGKLLIRLRSRTKAKAEVAATRERAHLLHRVYGLEVEVVAERQGPPPATALLATVSPEIVGQLR